MTAIMTVSMTIHDKRWIATYNAAVPALLAEYGAVMLAASRGGIRRLEGTMDAPDRIAVFVFPSMDVIDRFMADERYRPFRRSREEGAASEIFVFENAAAHRKLV